MENRKLETGKLEDKMAGFRSLVRRQIEECPPAREGRAVGIDLGLKSLKPQLGVICYGLAIVGSIVAALVALGVL